MAGLDKQEGLIGGDPLRGTIVLDISSTPGAGFASSMLADFGADVFMCEPSGGCALRHVTPPEWWYVMGRNKKSAVVDASQINGCVAKAHMLLTDLAPVDSEGNPWLRAVATSENPPLVVNLFATGGDRPDLWPWSRRPELTAAVTGMMALTGEEDGMPIQPEFPLAEYLAGVLAAMRGVAELRRVRMGGQGRLDVSVALHEAVLRMIEWQMPIATANGSPALRQANAFPLNAGISNLHRTRDGKYVATSAANQASAVRLMTMIGGPELAQDPRFATVEARARDLNPMYEIIDRWMATRSVPELMKEAAAHDVVLGPIYDTDDIFEDKHIASRGSIAWSGAVPMPAVTPRISGYSPRPFTPPPGLGAHTDELMNLAAARR